MQHNTNALCATLCMQAWPAHLSRCSTCSEQVRLGIQRCHALSRLADIAACHSLPAACQKLLNADLPAACQRLPKMQTCMQPFDMGRLRTLHAQVVLSQPPQKGTPPTGHTCLLCCMPRFASTGCMLTCPECQLPITMWTRNRRKSYVKKRLANLCRQPGKQATPM